LEARHDSSCPGDFHERDRLGRVGSRTFGARSRFLGYVLAMLVAVDQSALPTGCTVPRLVTGLPLPPRPLSFAPFLAVIESWMRVCCS